MELLDDPAIPFEDIRQNMVELDTINSLLGGHAVTLKGFRQLVGQHKNLHVCEIGCGGGDNLSVIRKWCDQHGIQVQLSGIDINPNCIAFAREKYSREDIKFICSDYKNHVFNVSPDILFSSLFCHHFKNEELVPMLKWLHEQCRVGFFINDLHRHPFAFYSIKLLTSLSSRSRLVKHDAPLSVLRGFIRNEWRELLERAQVEGEISWKWAFRHLVVCKK